MSAPTFDEMERRREIFEMACKSSGVQSRVKFPLNTMNINGRFHYYMDSDTDSAWLGFCIGFNRGLAENPNKKGK